MYKVHLIAIGETDLLNLAIALKNKKNYQITGSDTFINPSNHKLLEGAGLIPEELGWFPEKLNKNLSAVIIGQKVDGNNPELIKANELGLKIFTLIEYLFQQTRNKTRLVVSGSKGKSITTRMILHVLKSMRIDADYYTSEPIQGNKTALKLSYDSRVAVLQSDVESAYIYKPHIAIITGISSVEDDDAIGMDKYVKLFRKFIDQMEFQGRLIYFKTDESLAELVTNARRDIIAFPYSIPKEGEFGIDQKVQHVNAAKLACKQIGVNEKQFMEAIRNFDGLVK